MVNPLLLAGIIAAKKVAVYTVGSAYGWPRLYRHFVKTQIYLQPNSTPAERQQIRSVVKQTFRLPNKAVDIVKSNKQAIQLIDTVAQNTERLQPFLNSIPNAFSPIVSSVLKLWKSCRSK